jgi:5-methyltetrahydrofolate--homocysteine methyltransferase
MLCIETMTDLAEATLAIEGARSVSGEIPIAATMTFDPTPNGFFTIMGTTIEQAVRGLADAGANVIGSNCGNGIDKMVEIAEEMRRHTTLPLMIQSNAGVPELAGDEVIYPETPEQMAAGCSQLLDLGVSIVGGCCGTTAEHIAAIREMVDRRS